MTNSRTQAVVIILAAGEGRRFIASTRRQTQSSPQPPKCYQLLAGQPVLHRACQQFQLHPALTTIIPIIRPTERAWAQQSLVGIDKAIAPVAGGNTRLESLRIGVDRSNELLAATNSELILVHDAARPLVSSDIIDHLLAAMHDPEVSAALPALNCHDAIASCNRAQPAQIATTISDPELVRLQTPMIFRAPALRAVTTKVLDAKIPEWQRIVNNGGKVVRVPGAEQLHKITTLADHQALAKFVPPVAHTVINDCRSGFGFDIHTFAPDRPLWLGGVKLRSTNGLQGHSDADVLLHAACDAIYGLLAAGDIGQHFPPSDAKWRNAASSIFAQHALALLQQHRYRLSQLDCTVLAEQPKLSKYRNKIIASLAQLFDLPQTAISLKATSCEGLGAIGRSEGIAAMTLAVATKY